jgi:hypothetical protein
MQKWLFSALLEVLILHGHYKINFYACLNRKVCANCHCPREEHDVRPHHDEKHTTTNVGKILFHPTIINEAAKSPKRQAINSLVYNHFNHRHRSPIAGAKQLESPSDTPSILRKTHNFTWTPKDCSVDAVILNYNGNDR